MTRVLFSIVSLMSLLAVQETAFANSCRYEEYNVSRASSEVSRAQSNVNQAQDSYYRTQDMVSRRLNTYQYQIDLARYNLSRVNSLSAGNTARCIVRTLFFWRSSSCIGSAVYAARNRKLQAQYRVNTAVARYNSYVTYAQGYLYRSAQRITTAQERVAIAESRLEDAQDTLRECQSGSVY